MCLAPKITPGERASRKGEAVGYPIFLLQGVRVCFLCLCCQIVMMSYGVQRAFILVSGSGRDCFNCREREKHLDIPHQQSVSWLVSQSVIHAEVDYGIRDMEYDQIVSLLIKSILQIKLILQSESTLQIQFYPMNHVDHRQLLGSSSVLI